MYIEYFIINLIYIGMMPVLENEIHTSLFG